MDGDRTPPRGSKLLAHLIVETRGGTQVVPIMEPEMLLRWRVADQALLLDEPAEGELEPDDSPRIPLHGQHARTRLRWRIAYREGRFWVTGSERPLTLLASVNLDPAAVVDWPGGATVTWEGLEEIRVGLQRDIPVPRDTVHCPDCGRAIKPIPLRYGPPSAFVAELSRRHLVALGGSIDAVGQPTHACPMCNFAFRVDEDVLAPSVFEAYCEWIDAHAGSGGILVVRVVNDDDGQLTTLRFDDPQEVIVGSGIDCSVVLSDPEVESMHARIVRKEDGEVWIADLASDNGTFVNGERLSRPRSVSERDLIVIGPYSLKVLWRNLRSL